MKMKKNLGKAALAALCAAGATAKNILGNTHIPKGAVQFDIQGIDSDWHPRFTKRSGDAEVSLPNRFMWYAIDLEVGTPPQKIHCLLDTGSSDLWVHASTDKHCDTEINCGDSGTFDHKKSKTFHMNDTSFYLGYVDGTYAEGKWGTDKVKFGSVTIDKASVAVAFDSNSSQSVFGVGFADFESTSDIMIGEPGKGYTYSNIPMLLKEDGHIERVAYSLWLNDLEAKQGNILFGGVDHEKYEGTLATVPMVNTLKEANKPVKFTVMLSDIRITDIDGHSSYVMKSNIPVLLDSGTSFCGLPNDVFTAIGESLGAQYDDGFDRYLAPCSNGETKAALTFDFNGAKVKIPLSQLLVPLVDQNNDIVTFTDGQAACVVGVEGADDYILGDTFLRGAYVVYDLESKEIALARTKFGVSKSNIEVIKNSIPHARKASGYSNTKFAESVQVHTASDAKFKYASGTRSGWAGYPTGPIDLAKRDDKDTVLPTSRIQYLP